ncbi:MAG: imidazole glycerol phosphate synthase subunit HisH [Akkermansiaceae bacterium]|nr:imidazole glycerol phosphate synthase subunit HisH [Akkermansiaceae bacterium]
MKVSLIDYGAGNLRSVANALRAIGVEPEITSGPGIPEGTTHLVLPGVGSFGDCMDELSKRGLIEPIRQWVLDGKPYLGICLGYQILFEWSEETPGVAGLGVLPGQVKRFTDQPGVKVPHMGWNSVVPRRAESGSWQGLGLEPYFYYVHSYFPVPADDSIIAAETEYGGEKFAAAVERPNLLACQYHPEKSQEAGLRLIRNFLGV